MVVTCVEGEPASVQINLEPGTEVHRRGIGGDADVAEIASAVTRRDVHATAQRDAEMREIAADADALFMAFPRGPIASGVVITETDAVVGIVADRLHPLPPRRDATEKRPGQ